MTAPINRPTPCPSCPFRARGDTAFLPETLDATIGENLRTGYAHKCHQDLGTERERLCAGFMAFTHRQGIPNRMLIFAGRLGILGEVMVPDGLLIPGDWRAVLAEHARRLGWRRASASGPLVARGDEVAEGLGGEDADTP